MLRLHMLQPDDTDAAALTLPRGLTALTVHVLADVPPFTVTAPLRQLRQLATLRRLDLRFLLRGEHAGCAVLPTLPAGLTHLTVGVRQVNCCTGETLEPSLHGQVTYLR